METKQKIRATLVPASYVILIKDNKTLLLKRANSGYYDGHYGLIAGHVESHESFFQAAIREAKEESGIILTPEDLEIVHIMQRWSDYNPQKEDGRMDIFFHAKRWGGELHNAEPHKCTAMNWAPLNALPELTIPYIRTALENIQNGIKYSEFNY